MSRKRKGSPRFTHPDEGRKKRAAERETESEPEPEPEPEADLEVDLEPEPEPEPEALLYEPPLERLEPLISERTEADNATVKTLEQEVGQLRAELVAFIQHADTALARIERLLMSIRDIDDPEARLAPLAPVQPSRGRGFVGGWRTHREQ